MVKRSARRPRSRRRPNQASDSCNALPRRPPTAPGFQLGASRSVGERRERGDDDALLRQRAMHDQRCRQLLRGTVRHELGDDVLEPGEPHVEHGRRPCAASARQSGSLPVLSACP